MPPGVRDTISGTSASDSGGGAGDGRMVSGAGFEGAGGAGAGGSSLANVRIVIRLATAPRRAQTRWMSLSLRTSVYLCQVDTVKPVSGEC